jgi:small multidrug resistance pump
VPAPPLAPADGGSLLRRAPYYRIVFGLAALYNLGFGLWAGLAPFAFFDLFEMRPPLYPAIWSCLGMVVGTYGLGYAYAALHLERARPFIVIGLLGKILGPIGWVLTVRLGEFPVRTFPLVLFNDLVWWLPFALFLLDDTRLGRRLRDAAAPVCATLNAVAALALVAVLRPGTEVVPDPADRAAFIASHPVVWRAGWSFWIAAALSLLAFYAWWGAGLRRPLWARAAFLVAAAGVVCDLSAESLFIGWLPDRIGAVQRLGSVLTGGAANGLYTVAGVMLTVQTETLRGPIRIWAWTVWTAGFLLTATTLAGSVLGMTISAAALMTLFCPWVWVVGRVLR